jgi:hypothetical protein
MSDTHTLDEAILDTELRYINFFNGRLLSAEDLSQEQSVSRARARHLGRALGAGVAFGLEVSAKIATEATDGLVEVEAGLAVNATGQTLRLKCKETVALVGQPDPSETSECLFADCAPLAAGATASAEGFYVLTIAPASKRAELAPVSGLGSRVADCNSKYYTEGVKFRLLRLLSNPTGATARNTIAYDCLGHPNVNDVLTFGLGSGSEADYGLENLVAAGDLTDEDVPLAIVEWKPTGELGFIDLWSVRRRITYPAAEGRWSFFISDQRRSEAEAMFLQFQEQIRSITMEPSGTVRAVDRFVYLPPAGILPAHPRLAGWFTFLGLTSDDWSDLAPELVRSVLARAFGFEPLPVEVLSSNPVKIYKVTGRDDVLFIRRRADSTGSPL